jgi:hypothetical protein
VKRCGGDSRLAERSPKKSSCTGRVMQLRNRVGPTDAPWPCQPGRTRCDALTTANFRPRAGATLAAPPDRRAKLHLEADATSNTPSPDLSCVVQALDAWWDQPPLFPHTDQFGRGSHASSADSTNIPCTYDSLSRRLPTSYIHYSAVTPTHATVLGTWG